MSSWNICLTGFIPVGFFVQRMIVHSKPTYRRHSLPSINPGHLRLHSLLPLLAQLIQLEVDHLICWLLYCRYRLRSMLFNHEAVVQIGKRDWKFTNRKKKKMFHRLFTSFTNSMLQCSADSCHKIVKYIFLMIINIPRSIAHLIARQSIRSERRLRLSEIAFFCFRLMEKILKKVNNWLLISAAIIVSEMHTCDSAQRVDTIWP